MSLALVSVLGLSTFLAALALTRAVESYARRALVDIPNARSSHDRPTPRGGGIAIVGAHLAALAVGWWSGWVERDACIAFGGGGTLIAAIGWIDDHGHLAAPLRLAAHAAGFLWCIAFLGDLPPVDFGFGAIDLGPVGLGALLLYQVWFLNAFNFMDGIDGIAGLQALTMAAVGAGLAWWFAATVVAGFPLFALAAACAGFLVWNWPPARIFMGDVGSGYLGFALGALAFGTVIVGALTPWVWLILGGAFLADATVTLYRRMRGGARITEAHRTHAYQRLARRWGSHRRVALAYFAANLCWFGPWACVAARWPAAGFGCAVLALLPAFVLAWKLGAGEADELA